jgi:acetyl esterase/lipase
VVDSAGGGLALATLLWIRDAGLPLPAGAFLFSPWTDLAATGDSLVTNDKSDQMFCGRDVGRFSKVCFGEASPLDPLVSHFTQLSPRFRRFASMRAARKFCSTIRCVSLNVPRFDGVPVDLRIWSGLLHVWPVLVRFGIPESMRVVDEVAGFIRELLLAGNPVPAPSPLYASINDNFYPTVVGSLGIDHRDKI